MAAIAHNEKDDIGNNGHRMSRDDVEQMAEATARDLLGVSADEAFAMLDRGELDGTLASSALRSMRFLLAA